MGVLTPRVLTTQEALHMFEEQHAVFLAVMLALAGRFPPPPALWTHAGPPF
jgi:hypothetical protein